MTTTYDTPETPDRITVDETFSWTSFEMTAPVELPTNPGGAYVTTLTAEVHDTEIDDSGAQVWALKITVPNRVGPGSTMATITKHITVPGWREAVAYAEKHLGDIAAAVAVAAEARRLFNHAIRHWTGGGLDDLDVREAVRDLLEEISHVGSRRYRVKADPFHDTAADVDAGQGVN